METPITLAGTHVRLEPLTEAHVDDLAAAGAIDRSTYQWTWVPDGVDDARTYVDRALDMWREGSGLPFVHVLPSGRVIGSTRYCRIGRWDWPAGHPNHGRPGPDVVEVGYTWLAADQQRTAVNTEAKLLMLGQAFDVWGVHRVSIVTDRRNDRSRRAIERLGATLVGVLPAERIGVDDTVRDTAIYVVTPDTWPRVRAGLVDRLLR